MSVKTEQATEINLLKAYQEGAFSLDELMNAVGPEFGALIEVSPEAAIRIVLAAGGREFWVPLTTDRNSLLQSMLDDSDFKILCSIYRGCRLKVPTLNSLRHAIRRRKIAALRRNGWKLRELAEHFQLTDRQIIKILKKHQEEKC